MCAAARIPEIFAARPLHLRTAARASLASSEQRASKVFSGRAYNKYDGNTIKKESDNKRYGESEKDAVYRHAVCKKKEKDNKCAKGSDDKSVHVYPKIMTKACTYNNVYKTRLSRARPAENDVTLDGRARAYPERVRVLGTRPSPIISSSANTPGPWVVSYSIRRWFLCVRAPATVRDYPRKYA